MYMVAGYYLAFFFSISHNFKEVFMMEDTSREASNHKNGTFLYKQVKYTLYRMAPRVYLICAPPES